MASSPPIVPAQVVQFSRAFDNIVESSDDVVGLLAYALFKEAVREEARQGAQIKPAERNPPPATVKIYRGAAEQRLAQIISDGISQATPDIQASTISLAIQNAETALVAKIFELGSQVERQIKNRTSFITALATNLLAWLATLAITVIILLLSSRGKVEDVALNSAKSILDSAGASNTKTEDNGVNPGN